MDKLTRAYVAGIVDGEGSIQLTVLHKGNTRSPVISIASTDFELLEFLKETTGGFITKKRVYKDHHKPGGEWRITGRKAIDFLLEIRPFLRIHRKQQRADIILKEYINLTPRNGKYTEEMVLQKEEMIVRFLAI